MDRVKINMMTLMGYTRFIVGPFVKVLIGGGGAWVGDSILVINISVIIPVRKIVHPHAVSGLRSEN